MAKENAARTDNGSDAGAVLHNVTSSQAGSPSDLDRLIHDRVRLAIVSALAVNASVSFKDLKQLIKATDGNLSVHARKLEEAGYILCKKSFSGRLPRTDFELTSAGRAALERYLDHMEALIRAARSR